VGKVKFALVGCGRVSSRHIDALTNKVEEAELAAVCDIDRNRAKKCALLLNIPSFTSMEEMCNTIDVDVIDIATPSGDHYPRVMEALKYEKHVVVEKPIALRPEHVDHMIKKSTEMQKKLWVIHQNRYNPAVIKAKEAVDSERIGKLVAGTVRVRWSRNQDYYNQDDWHGTWAMDGGVLSQQAIHHVDALQWVMGEIDSIETSCVTRLVEMECEDVCIATLRFKNGALGIIEAMTAARPEDIEASLSILGENGTIILGGIAMNKIDCWKFTNPVPDDDQVSLLYSEEVPNSYGFGHDVLFRKVVESIRYNKPVEIPGKSGRDILKIIHAAYSSNELGKRINLKENPISLKLGVSETCKRSNKKTKISDPLSSLNNIQSCITNTIDCEQIKNRLFAGIIGEQPSKYAKSPLIWNYTFQQLGIDSVFLSFDVETDNLGKLIKALCNCEDFTGGSVTVPYKTAIIEYLDEVDLNAKSIGAVNTIVRTKEGRLIGYNTDGQGGIDSITRIQPGGTKPFLPSLENLNIVMIGSGGAGKAMAFYLAEAIKNGNLTIINRTAEEGKKLAAQVNERYSNASTASFNDITSILNAADLLVNCTICGQSGIRKQNRNETITLEPFSPLSPAKPNCIISSGNETVSELYRLCTKISIEEIKKNNSESMSILMKLKSQLAVLDIIYSPLETILLQQARFTGHSVLNGKGMNICQAADGMFNRVFRTFFEDRGIWNNQTYDKIVKIMYEVW